MAQSVFSSITVFGVHPDVPVRAFFMPKAKQTAHVSAHSTVHNISSIRQNGPYRQNFMRHPLSISWCTLTAYHFLSNTGNFLVCSRSFWFPLLQRKKSRKALFFFGQIGNVLSKRCLSKVICPPCTKSAPLFAHGAGFPLHHKFRPHAPRIHSQRFPRSCGQACCSITSGLAQAISSRLTCQPVKAFWRASVSASCPMEVHTSVKITSASLAAVNWSLVRVK